MGINYYVLRGVIIYLNKTPKEWLKLMIKRIFI